MKIWIARSHAKVANLWLHVNKPILLDSWGRAESDGETHLDMDLYPDIKPGECREFVEINDTCQTPGDDSGKYAEIGDCLAKIKQGYTVVDPDDECSIGDLCMEDYKWKPFERAAYIWHARKYHAVIRPIAPKQVYRDGAWYWVTTKDNEVFRSRYYQGEFATLTIGDPFAVCVFRDDEIQEIGSMIEMPEGGAK